MIAQRVFSKFSGMKLRTDHIGIKNKTVLKKN